MTSISEKWINRHAKLFDQILEYCLDHQTVRSRRLSNACGCSAHVAGAVLSYLHKQGAITLWRKEPKYNYNALYAVNKEKIQELIDARKPNE